MKQFRLFNVNRENIHKVVEIFGIKFKFKDKNLELLKEISNLNEMLCVVKEQQNLQVAEIMNVNTLVKAVQEKQDVQSAEIKNVDTLVKSVQDKQDVQSDEIMNVNTLIKAVQEKQDVQSAEIKNVDTLVKSVQDKQDVQSDEINNVNALVKSVQEKQDLQSSEIMDVNTLVKTVQHKQGVQSDEIKNVNALIKSVQEQENVQLADIKNYFNDNLRNQLNKTHYIDLNVKEIRYSQILHDSILSSSWLKDKTFTLTGGAANYSFIYMLYMILDNVSPKNILEFGLGQSSKVTTQYINNNDVSSNLIIVDHNKDWIDYFSNKLQLSENIKIYHKNVIDFEYNNTVSPKYEPLDDILIGNKFDFIIVDGPIAKDMMYARTNIIDIIPEYLADDFIIIIDDAERIGEKNTAELLFKKFDDLGIKYLESKRIAAKAQMIITSKKYEFIHWY